MRDNPLNIIISLAIGALLLFFAILLSGCGGGGGGGGGGGFPIAAIPTAPIQPTPPVDLEPGPAPVPEAKNLTIALWGDSVLFGGYGLFGRIEIPPAMTLKNLRPQHNIIDHSQNGASATLFMPAFLSDQHPEDVVVLQYGINDAGHNMPYEVSMRSMIERALALKKLVVITGFSQGTIQNRESYNEIAQRLAVEYGVYFADWGSVKFQDEDTHDGVHPKQEYSIRLMSRLAEVIDRIQVELG